MTCGRLAAGPAPGCTLSVHRARCLGGRRRRSCQPPLARQAAL